MMPWRLAHVLSQMVLAEPHSGYLAATPMLGGGSKKGTQYASLVAVSKYGKTDQWRPLPYTIDEMKEFRDVLLDTGFAKENIEFLHDQQTDDKRRPTAANLVKKIKLMLDEIGPDDTLLIALNGHGVQCKEDAAGYFCPVNADLLDKKTLIPMDGKDGIYALLDKCKAKRKLLIVNACRNDPTRDLSFAAEKVHLVDKDEAEVPKGIAALFSCKPGQKSYYYPEEKKIKRSMFYHRLIEAWRGKYADGEKVTLDHVFDAVTRKTASDARTIFSEAQTPWARRKYEGEWTLGGWMRLFNGKDLKGWQVAANRDPFFVKPADSALVAGSSNPPGFLQSERDFADFHLRLEFKAATKNANSGVNLRCPAGAQEPIQLQVQIRDDSTPYEGAQTGSLYWSKDAKQFKREREDLCNPFGDWNLMEIIVRGQRIRVIVNGKQALDADLKTVAKDPTALAAVNRRSGRISLEAYVGEVWYRNIEIKGIGSNEK
ncbi:MAG: DUF1080 domain-containing protein [Planctomycetes bacterium]|nr:DUF1080 domain-containing protein [Planctomycetota bacterium]